MLSPKIASIERRSERRYQYVCGVEPLSSAPAGRNRASDPAAHAVVLNVSTGGACVLADKRSVEPFSVRPWRFQFPSVPVNVPVLAQVRWIAPAAADAKHVRIGLSFLA